MYFLYPAIITTARLIFKIAILHRLFTQFQFREVPALLNKKKKSY